MTFYCLCPLIPYLEEQPSHSPSPFFNSFLNLGKVFSSHAPGSDMGNHQFVIRAILKELVAGCWVLCCTRWMTLDRSRAMRETILMVSERILHWHIPLLTANTYCFRGECQGFCNLVRSETLHQVILFSCKCRIRIYDHVSLCYFAYSLHTYYFTPRQ
jgi:hypothetical protein